jgi:hypothetical protein
MISWTLGGYAQEDSGEGGREGWMVRAGMGKAIAAAPLPAVVEAIVAVVPGAMEKAIGAVWIATATGGRRVGGKGLGTA